MSIALITARALNEIIEASKTYLAASIQLSDAKIANSGTLKVLIDAKAAFQNQAKTFLENLEFYHQDASELILKARSLIGSVNATLNDMDLKKQTLLLEELHLLAEKINFYALDVEIPSPIP